MTDRMTQRRGIAGWLNAGAAIVLLASPVATPRVWAQASPDKAAPAASDRPWMNRALDADARARLLLAQMATEEKLRIVHGGMGRARLGVPAPEGSLGSAGHIPGNARLGIPALQETDAGAGVTNPGDVRPGDAATALPSGMAIAATWNRSLAYQSGVVLGDESWKKGFNVMLAGGVNLVREPRNGRNFEYLGEDPLLAGLLGGQIIGGIQSKSVASTIKHFALNNQETNRFTVDVRIGEAAARESDLLAFQLAIETGKPASVMCAYNLVNTRWACENDWLLNRVLKGDWRYPGWVMSDWGAVHSAEAPLHGLDQESGEQLDRIVYFGEPLARLVRSDRRFVARLDDMVLRILRSMFATGLFDNPPKRGPIDYAANGRVSQTLAEESIVLLRNRDAVLPLASPRRLAVIGGMAEIGVLTGGGSATTTAIEGPGTQIPAMGVWMRTMLYHPSSPLRALQAALPNTHIEVDGGSYPAAAAALARTVDVPIIFATQWTTESVDVPDLSLPNGQDALIEAVAAANPRTIVVLESGGPVRMPWIDKVAAVVSAWYPGGRGGEAIANVLTGKVDATGRLPVTFPVAEAQLPRPVLEGAGRAAGNPSDGGPIVPTVYGEGADVGYRWFARKRQAPLFPFGHGLSYTRFDYSNLTVAGGDTLTVSFTVRNSGTRAGADVPQVYLTAIGTRPELRLLGWEKVALAAGESRDVTLTVDRRLLANFDAKLGRWRVDGGPMRVALGRSATDLTIRRVVAINASTVAP